MQVVKLGSDRVRKPRRIVLYSHDGFGLGHLKRNYNIASALLAKAPDDVQSRKTQPDVQLIPFET